jgi:tRNA threonylcarbamoyladenosine biosynthesis protein TsaB
MAIILNIDTAVDTASICLSRESLPIKFAENRNQSDHAAWLHPALQKLATEAEIGIHEIDAIAISIGPGSYTGLRVGLAAAKGMCFALDIPLIAVNTLKMMAYTTKNEAADLFCPLIDARRMEVFTAVYDRNFTEFIEPKAMIIDSNSFDSILSSHKVLFSGNGSEKVRKLISHPNALFSNLQANATSMVELSDQYFRDKNFSDIAYLEPCYLKEFYSVAR